jgi:hypothetical protein
MLGIVLNGMKAELSPDFTKRDKYNYYYGYSDKRMKQSELARIKVFLQERMPDRVVLLWDRFQKKRSGNDHE